jgi:hypothetical protein
MNSAATQREMEKAAATKVAGRRQVNLHEPSNFRPLDTYAAIVRDIATAQRSMRNYLQSKMRHGELQVALSALRGAAGGVEALIVEEEQLEEDDGN